MRREARSRQGSRIMIGLVHTLGSMVGIAEIARTSNMDIRTLYRRLQGFWRDDIRACQSDDER
jgi:hypothetical protein